MLINSVCQHPHLEVIWIFAMTLSILAGWPLTLMRVKAIQGGSCNALWVEPRWHMAVGPAKRNLSVTAIQHETTQQ